MRQLTQFDLEFLAIGSAVLGSGGGGDPSYDILMAQHAMEKYGPVNLITINELSDEDFIIPVAFMGAPLIAIEKLPSGREFQEILQMVENTTGRRPTALMPAEIGGANAFTPFAIACQLNIPVLDADTIGRAFPQLQMNSCNLMGIAASPTYLADDLGNTAMIKAKQAADVEKLARQVTVAMGSSCAIALYLMSGEQAKRAVIPNTITQAIAIGRAIAEAQAAGKNPLEPFLNCTKGVILGCGTITDINQSVANGFLEGSVTIKNDQDLIELVYQNEYLLARKNGNVLATTPDILTILDSESGTPITSESLRFGLRVTVVAIPSPDIWKTAEGLKLVGPQFFGYEMEYQSINEVG